MNNPENDNSLSRVLGRWKVSDPMPPRFQEQVWKRIALAEATQEPLLLDRLLRLLEIAVPRPKFALSYVAILLVLGVVAGTLTASAKTSHLDADLSARYVQSINPYQSVTSRP